MSIIIDGYNLLSGAGIVANAPGPYTLEKSRRALLGFLSRVLQADERAQTTVVFDAKQAPPNLPRFYTWEEIQVVFAPRGEEADTVILEMISQCNAPRQLVVVSSDHAIQRAARRRRAKFLDSDRWFRERIRKLQSADDLQSGATASPMEQKANDPLDPTEVARWLAEFNDSVDHADSPEARERAEELKQMREPTNPFPKGYAEELLDDT